MGVRKDDAVRFVLSKLGGYVAKEGKRARQPSIPYTVSTCLSLTRSSWGWILDRTRHSTVQVVQHTCTGVGTGGSQRYTGRVGVEFGGTDSRVKLYAQGGLECTLGSSALLSVSDAIGSARLD